MNRILSDVKLNILLLKLILKLNPQKPEKAFGWFKWQLEIG